MIVTNTPRPLRVIVMQKYAQICGENCREKKPK